MPHSLRAKLNGLRYKGILEDKDYKRLCHALDLENAEQEPSEDMTIAYLMGYYADKEPCDDAVSREAVLEIAKQHTLTNDYLAIQNLPTVRPQEQTGKWEEIVKEHKCFARDDTYTTTEYYCSECGAEPFTNEDGFYEFSNYCPNCGARMVEPKESEDKE